MIFSMSSPADFPQTNIYVIEQRAIKMTPFSGFRSVKQTESRKTKKFLGEEIGTLLARNLLQQ